VNPYRAVIAGLWLAWALYWWAAARDIKPLVRRETPLSRLLHVVPLCVAVVLFWLPPLSLPGVGPARLEDSATRYWIGVALTAAGLLFAVWARVHIGRNWSGTVTLKEEHELITSGPYRFARHPIYTGMLLALCGTALARGDWQGALAVLIVFLALWRKLRLEERWMREQFGARYEQYSARVKRLVPFLW